MGNRCVVVGVRVWSFRFGGCQGLRSSGFQAFRHKGWLVRLVDDLGEPLVFIRAFQGSMGDSLGFTGT